MKSITPIILAVIINEVCGNETSQPKNIGGKKQCLEAPVNSYALAKEGFSFDSVSDAKDIEKWKTAIQEKNIVPFPFVEAIEANNTEASIKNGRFKDYTLKEAVRGSTYRQDLAICTHAAVKSYENSDYTRIFRLTGDNEITAEIQDDGTVKGEALSSFIVGIRNEATDADVPFTNVQLKYAQDAFSILKADFDVNDLEGIYDVNLSQVSATATSIKIKAVTGCSGSNVDGLTDADFVVKDATGAVDDSLSFVPPVDGVYEFTGTDIANGYTVELNGVVAQAEISYETPEPLTITIS